MTSWKPAQVKRDIAESLASKPTWKIKVEKSWMCPYCAELAVSDLSRYPDPIPRLYRHITKDCVKWNDGEGKEKPLKKLQERRFYLIAEKVVKKNLDHPSWQFTDAKGFWLCPYSGELTDIKLARTKEFVAAAVKHLLGSYAFEKGKGKIKSESYLRKLANYDRQVKKLAAQVKYMLQNNSRWKVSGPEGGWVCPFTNKEVHHIDVSNPLAFTLNAPNQIAKYLVASCKEYLTPEGELPSLARPKQESPSKKKKTRKVTTIRIKTGDDNSKTDKKAQPQAKKDPKKPGPPPGATPVRRGDSMGESTSLIPLYSEDQMKQAIEEDTKKKTEKLSRPMFMTDFGDKVDEASTQDQPMFYTSDGEEDPGLAEESDDTPLPVPEAVSVEDEEETVADEPSAMELAGMKASAQAQPLEDLSATGQIQIASRQLDMLPLMPDMEQVEFQFVYEINHSGSIDFLDFVQVGEDEVGIFMIHLPESVPPSVINQLKAFIQERGVGVRSPRDFLNSLDQDFWSEKSADIPLMVTYFIINSAKDILRMARAGHNPVLIYNPNRNRSFHELKPRGCALGLEDAGFQEEGGELRVRLHPQDLLVGYNQGILDTADDKGPFGEKRFYKLVEKYGRHEGEYFRHKFLEKFNQFRESVEARTNLLLIAAKYKDDSGN